MELEYLKVKINSWMQREFGSFYYIDIKDVKSRIEDVDGESIEYCESCTVEISLPNSTAIDYRVLVDWDNGELHYYRRPPL